MLRNKIIRTTYKNIVKPVFFKYDAELIHNLISKTGEGLGSYDITRKITRNILSFENSSLSQNLNNTKFVNPIGLSAGFDYDGHMSKILPSVGFGFNTIGTVTAKPYIGNPSPRLIRLPESKSLLVNKGFKSSGVKNIKERLRKMDLAGTIGISIGSSNLPEIDTINKAISDYLYSFNELKNEQYISYFELNISCPNTALTENFSKKENLFSLLNAIQKAKIRIPIFIKMANELNLEITDTLVETALKFDSIKGFIFSNLVKDRDNPLFNKNEIDRLKNYKGNFSGRPTYSNSNKLISHAYKKYGKHTTIIGCGGIFSAQDAYEKIKSGASLVQLITGMVYEGPQLIGEINEDLTKLLSEDGFKNISEAVGIYNR